MPDDAMTISERRKYLERMAGRYRRADRLDRGRLLDEMEAMTGLHRKSLLRLLGTNGLERQPRTRQRGRVYGSAVDDALRVIWESLDYVCAERLTPGLVPTAQRLAAHGELALTPELAQHLGQISVASVQRRLTRLAQDTPRLPRKGPEHANRVARTIPMGRLAWDEPTPGHFEVDLVHHSGPTTQGEYLHTLQMIDVATGWSERVAVLGRSYRHMAAGFTHILKRLPFPVLELHPDNGSEFLNDHLVRFWDEAARGLTWSRSRPYQKNDNRFVEQKNDSLVRAYFGNARLDTLEQWSALNAIYDQMWQYYNLFQPVLRLTEKAVIDGRRRRRWAPAQTPFARLCATGVLSATQRQALDTQYAATNPRALRRAIYAAIAQVWAPAVPLAADPAA
jgi:hypothetical protein